MLEVLLQLCHGHLVGLGLGALVRAVVPPPTPHTPPPAAAAAWQLDHQSAEVQDQVLAALLKVTLLPTRRSPTRRNSTKFQLRLPTCKVRHLCVYDPSQQQGFDWVDGQRGVRSVLLEVHRVLSGLRIAEAYAGCAVQCSSHTCAPVHGIIREAQAAVGGCRCWRWCPLRHRVLCRWWWADCRTSPETPTRTAWRCGLSLRWRAAPQAPPSGTRCWRQWLTSCLSWTWRSPGRTSRSAQVPGMLVHVSVQPVAHRGDRNFAPDSITCRAVLHPHCEPQE